MNEIVTKYSRLNKSARKQVIDFMDFLISKQKSPKNRLLTSFKSRILKVSVWTGSDLEIFDETRDKLNNWMIREW